MVKLEDIPVDNVIPNLPNSSLVILDEDKILIHLYADGFGGYNGQVGIIEVRNILYRDNRKYIDKLKYDLGEYMSILTVSNRDKITIRDAITYFLKYVDGKTT